MNRLARGKSMHTGLAQMFRDRNARGRPIQAPIRRAMAGHARALSIAGCAYIIMNAMPAKARSMAMIVNSVPETIALSIGGPSERRDRVGRGWWN